MQMKATRMESLVALYKEQRNGMLLNRLRRDYGDRILLYLGRGELDIYIDTFLNDVNKTFMISEIDKVDELRAIYNRIIERFVYHCDDDFNQSVLYFIRNYDFRLGKKLIKKENQNFLCNMIRTKYNNMEESWDSDIKFAIISNTTMELNDLLELAEINTEMYEEIIANIPIYIRVQSLFDILFEIDKIKSIMEDHNIKGGNNTINVNKIVRKGLEFFFNTDWYFNYGYDLIRTIDTISAYKIDKYKELFKEFMECLFVCNEATIENVILAFNNYKEDYGLYPVELISESLDTRDVSTIFFILMYGEDYQSKNAYLLGVGNLDYEFQLNHMINSFDLLIKEGILPESIKSDPLKYIETIGDIRFNEETNTTPMDFDLDEFLGLMEMED